MGDKNNETIVVHQDKVTYGDAEGDTNRAAAVAKVDREEEEEEGCGYYITPAGHEYLQQQKDNSPPSH